MMERLRASPRKRPIQSRSRETVAAILDAAAHILAKEEYAAFTTNRVAERSGVSIGSLYQYFPNKQALLVALHERHLRELLASGSAIIAEAEGQPLADTADHLVREIVASHAMSADLHRALAEEVPYSLSETSMLALMRKLIEAYRPTLAVEDPDQAAYIIAVSIKNVVHGALRERPDDLRSGRLEREIVRLILVYLTGDGVH